MGRDISGLRIDKKPSTINVRLNGTDGPVLVSPRAVPEKIEANDHEPDNQAVKGRVSDELNRNQDVVGVKSTKHEPNEKIIRAEIRKSTEKSLSSPVKTESCSANNGTIDANSSEPVAAAVEDEIQSSFANYSNGAETNDSGAKYSPRDDPHSPNTINKFQPRSPSMLSKQHSQYKKFYDDEDAWSMASSNATSVRTNKSRVTVPVAPKFTVDDRLERRKEYYAKLEEKHQAMDKERKEYQARIKEEEAAAIKQLRKSMVVKANPVPTFYREGPPPKPELKKLPVTRAKSPNLTRGSARRRSCGDAIKASPEDKGLNGRTTRHSVGVYREGKNSPLTPKGKDQIAARKWNEASKLVKDKAKNSPKEAREPAKTENSPVC